MLPYSHSVHPLPLSTGEVWISYQIFNKGGGLDRISVFRGALFGKKEWYFLGGIADFT